MNISEIAKLAGVSKSAVSRYFNDGYISEEKRERIRQAVEKTGYDPNNSGRRGRKRITNLVGVIIPKLSSESCAKMTEGISEALSKEGYQILLVNASNDIVKETEFLDLFRNNRVDGVIFIASAVTKLHLMVMNKMHVPVIVVGQSVPGFSCVCHDDEGAAYALTRLMIDKGARRPAMIGVDKNDLSVGQARFTGFSKALSESGMKLYTEQIETAKSSVDSGYDKANKLLSKSERPDALFCATDNIAAGAMICCRDHGLRIPEDIMIVGVGDSKVGNVTPVPITSAHLHYKTAGAEAAGMLLAELKQKNSVRRVLKLEYDIVERGSTMREQTE